MGISHVFYSNKNKGMFYQTQYSIKITYMYI